jgi:D-methionine transport system ATP-binding protein
MIIITHEIGVVQKICNKVAVIDSSVIVEQGSTEYVLQHPCQHITKQLLGEVDWGA